MEGQRLILKNGKIIEDGNAVYASGFLWLYFTGYTLQEAGALFFNPAKTDRIVFQYGEMEDVYEHFTECRTLMIDVDGLVSVCMERERADA